MQEHAEQVGVELVIVHPKAQWDLVAPADPTHVCRPAGYVPPRDDQWEWWVCPQILAEYTDTLSFEDAERYLQAVMYVVDMSIIHYELPDEIRMRLIEEVLHERGSYSLKLLSGGTLNALDTPS